VCSSGHPAGAATLLLRSLAAAGAALRYHGDLDWPGIAIVNRIFSRFPVLPWHFDATAYRAAAAVGSKLARRPGSSRLAPPIDRSHAHGQSQNRRRASPGGPFRRPQPYIGELTVLDTGFGRFVSGRWSVPGGCMLCAQYSGGIRREFADLTPTRAFGAPATCYTFPLAIGTLVCVSTGLRTRQRIISRSGADAGVGVRGRIV
jgi:hypothetical protein